MVSCSLCKKSLEKNEKVVEFIGNTFHRVCYDQLASSISESKNEESVTEDTTQKPDENPSSSTTHRTYGNQTSGEAWECKICRIGNLASAKRCSSCGKSRHICSSSTNESLDVSNIEQQCGNLSLYNSSQPTHDYDDGESTKKTLKDDYDNHGSDSDTQDNDYYHKQLKEDNIKPKHNDNTRGNRISRVDHEQSRPSLRQTTTVKDVKVTKIQASPSPSNSQRAHLVYIPDLPSDMTDNLQLEQMIRRRIEDILEIKLRNVNCYTKLGIGVIQVIDSQLRDRLIKIGKLALNPKDTKYFINFTDNIELVSYLVLDVPEEQKDAPLPSTKDIARRWTDLHNGDEPSTCDALNAQFPNIYRIVSTSLDKLINTPHSDVFKIKSFLAHVYYCADCSFFEDLPRSITKNQLEDSIAACIGQSNISPTSFYIEVNKQAATACIIVADTARVWCTKSHITIGKNVLSKKTALGCRLVIHPVPKSLSIQSIINHPELNGTVTNHKQSGDRLILDISDKDVFQRCIDLGALRIDKQYLVYADLCSTFINPEESEIDADTWYEADMVKYSPDIMQFVANPQHPIFLYRWNSQIWLQQFKSVATQKRDNNRSILHNPKSPTPDQQRHQLRVTVMLNTLGVIRKGSYMIDDQEVKLNLKKELKTIVYDHRSKLERPEKMPLKTTPHSQTTVHVLRQDCLLAYQNMVTSGKRPLLLNMASATSPGGGFRKGDGAQEENIFRRSDYSRSLDVDLDEFFQQQPQRLHCSSDCKFEPMSARDKMYPMNEFGAIYTSGITVFRQSEDSGYAFMENPLEDVCAIAMAAYRDPELKGNMLAPKYAVGTRKKIENIFAIAHHHKHDSLVLSAFGCGAFKNPPDHIVKLFQSVIEQYAGFFKSIVFAIVDDHNAGRQLNPEGNFQPFASVLGEEIIVQPNTSMNRPNTSIGPYRLLGDGSTVNNVSILDLNPCHHGAKCNEIYDPQHSSQFAHPPLCIEAVVSGKCKSTNDPVHMNSFLHRNQCRNGGECEQINDEKHNREFEHPDYCLDEGKCQNQQEDHLRQYRHLPFCKKSHRCMDFQKQVPEHCRKYRHCAPRCPRGNHCVLFHDKAHLDEFQHPFTAPCQQTPFDCSHHSNLAGSKNIGGLPTAIQQHCLDFAHVCIWGRNCTDKTALHWSKSIHIARHMCSYDGRCNKLNDEGHLNSWTHSKIPDIRPTCLYLDKCRDRHKVDHKLQFRHPISSEDGVVQYYGSNEHTNFVQNQKDNIDCINDYITTHKWKPLPSGSIPQEILNWFRTVQPIHRCSPTIFESILLHGHVMSREYMEHLRDPKFVVNSVFQHSRVQRITALKIKTLENDARDYITALVQIEFEKSELSTSTTIPSTSTASPLTSLTSLPPTTGTHASISMSKSYSTSEHYANIIKKKENKLSGAIPDNDMKALRTKAIEIAQACIKLHSDPAGIGYAPDKALGTDKLVFSVLGPHLGHYYGDVIIIFKRKILHHPDANFSIQAATSFASGNCYHWRPWLGSDSGSDDERVKHFHRTKLHAAVPGYEYAAALELIALTSLRLKSKTMDIDLQQMFDEWVKVDSHQNIEAHLPQLIPLDYIDHIYIPQNIFDDLSDNARRAIDALFKHRITTVPHACDVSHGKGTFGPAPSPKSRADYQNFVIRELLDRYKQYATHSSPNTINGFMITIPSTSFDDHYIMPLTISQAYAEYRTQHTHPSKDNIIYIYWKALHGDMMLTLSNEEIDPEEKQLHLRCLICYVAPKSESSDNHYHEQTSYLTSGHPFQHAIIINKKAYKTKSNTFYTGCDPNDFTSYCLEIHRSTGTTTLSHAGPNAIYNHEKMSCVFNKSELDLSKLEYIHVGTGAHTVSIRNLMICFEKKSDWHPTFDENYKRSDSSMTVDEPVSTSASTSLSHRHGARRVDDAHSARSKSPRKSVSSSRQKSPSVLGLLKSFVFGDQDSSLEPCPQNVNCLFGYAEDGEKHNSKFSHPCRYSELCRENEPHLTHEPNPVPRCEDDKECADLVDPLHRASYRHTNLPDFLIPCDHQKKCHDTSRKHRIRCSHGEQVYQIVASSMTKTTKQRMRSPSKTAQGHHSHDEKAPCKRGAECYDQSALHRTQYSHSSTIKSHTIKDDRRIPCKWGDRCRDSDSEHRAKYSHPSTTKSHVTKDDRRNPCKWGDRCRDSDSEHRAKYSHPSTTKSHVTKDDRRNPCKWGDRCRDNDSEHRRRFSHPD